MRFSVQEASSATTCPSPSGSSSVVRSQGTLVLVRARGPGDGSRCVLRPFTSWFSRTEGEASATRLRSVSGKMERMQQVAYELAQAPLVAASPRCDFAVIHSWYPAHAGCGERPTGIVTVEIRRGFLMAWRTAGGSGSPCSICDSMSRRATPCAISIVSARVRPCATKPGRSGLVARNPPSSSGSSLFVLFVTFCKNSWGHLSFGWFRHANFRKGVHWGNGGLGGESRFCQAHAHRLGHQPGAGGRGRGTGSRAHRSPVISDQ